MRKVSKDSAPDEGVRTRRLTPELTPRPTPRLTSRLTPEDIAILVDKAIRSFKETLDSASAKYSVGDLVRLVQLRKELTGEEPGNVTDRLIDDYKETLSD
jgi:hypothetical protein